MIFLFLRYIILFIYLILGTYSLITLSRFKNICLYLTILSIIYSIETSIEIFVIASNFNKYEINTLQSIVNWYDIISMCISPVLLLLALEYQKTFLKNPISPRLETGFKIFVISFSCLIIVYLLIFESDYKVRENQNSLQIFVPEIKLISYSIQSFFTFTTLSMHLCVLWVIALRTIAKRNRMFLFAIAFIDSLIIIALIYKWATPPQEPVNTFFLLSLMCIVSYILHTLAFSNFIFFDVTFSSSVYSIINNMNTWIILTDEKFLIKEVNKNFADIYNLDASTFIGKHLNSYFNNRLVNYLESKNDSKRLDIHIQLNGNEYYVGLNMEPINAKYKSLIGFIFLFTDLTKIEELERQRDDIELALKVASHDMIPPLQTILNSTYVIKTNPHNDLLEKLEDIEKCTEDALQLSNRVVALVKNGSFTTPSTIVDLDSVVEKVKRRLKRVIQENNAIITTQLPLPHVIGDEVLLSELFQNFIENAIKYRSLDLPVVTISFKVSTDFYSFQIADNGKGFNEKIVESIQKEEYKSFRRSDSKVEGSGLGISIANRILAKNGGKLKVLKNTPKGSVIQFTWPIRS